MIGILFISLAVLLILTVPVGVILLIISAIPSFLGSFAVDAQYIVRIVVEAFNNTTLLAIPLFILSGVIIAKGQISKKLYDIFAYFIGNLTGGLPSAWMLSMQNVSIVVKLASRVWKRRKISW